jgi:flagellar hook-basal body complex protein FliE
MTTATAAAKAYAALSKLSDPAALGKSSEAGAGSFGSVLKDVVGGLVDAGRKTDVQAQAMATGKANVVDVVTAVAETEVAIETLVAVRDRVIQAYEEIMRMPI